MSKHNDRKHSGRKGVMGTFLALLLIGALAIAVPVIMQDMERNCVRHWRPQRLCRRRMNTSRSIRL